MLRCTSTSPAESAQGSFRALSKNQLEDEDEAGRETIKAEREAGTSERARAATAPRTRRTATKAAVVVGLGSDSDIDTTDRIAAPDCSPDKLGFAESSQTQLPACQPKQH